MFNTTFYQLVLKALVDEGVLTTHECSEIFKQLVGGGKA